MSVPDLPQVIDVVVEVARGSRVKRHPDGRIQYISPLVSPFDYGYAPDAPLAGDGDPQDVVLVGTTARAGSRVRAKVVGVVYLLDGGARDDKWIAVAADTPEPSDLQQQVTAFFIRYRRMKNLLAALRRRTGVVLLDAWYRS